MGAIAMAIIDGTGPYDSSEYKRDMAVGFCSQMSMLFKGSNYQRGPTNEGYHIESRATAAATHLITQYRIDPSTRLMLAGYSRGGSIAVIAAEMVRTRIHQHIDAMFLFDPVARHFSASSELIPGNVKRCYIARRQINNPKMDKYDFTLVAGIGDLLSHNPARNWFGGTARKHTAAWTILREKTFLGSHGAIGGVGWKHVSEDPACQANVAAFMNEAFIHADCKLPGKLLSVPPSSTPPAVRPPHPVDFGPKY